MKNAGAKGQVYEVVVRGELDSRFAYLFGDMHMECASGTTVLTGPVIDQTQLHGILDRLEELGLELVSVQRTGDV